MILVESPEAVHPLTPLTPAELEQATGLLKRGKCLGDAFRFVWVYLGEPEKEALRGWPEQQLPRLAKIVGFDRGSSTVYEAVVSLTDQKVVEWRDVPGARAPMTFGEWVGLEPVVKADARWQEAMRKRGVTDFDLVHIDPWGPTSRHRRPGGATVALS